MKHLYYLNITNYHNNHFGINTVGLSYKKIKSIQRRIKNLSFIGLVHIGIGFYSFMYSYLCHPRKYSVTLIVNIVRIRR